MQYWKKSILLQVYNINTKKTEYAYTLTIPPESWELTIPQRVSKTKTFGGVFIDDYGIDNAKLTLSGTTGGVTVRESYPNYLGSDGGLDGRAAIYELRDKIVKYKNGKSNLGEYAIRVFDLSSFDQTRSDRFNARLSNYDAYECVLEDFRISRNKDRPLWYNYSIEFFVIRSLGEYKQKKLEVLADPKMLDASFKVIKKKGKSLFQQIDDIYYAITGVKDSIYGFAANVLSEYDALQSRIEGWANGLSQTVGDFAKFPAAVANSVLGRLNVLKNFFSKGIVDYYTNWGEDIVGSYLQVGDNFNILFSPALDSIVAGKKIGNTSATIGVVTAEQSPMDRELSVPDTQSLNVVVESFTPVVATSSTTFESLALEYMGDAKFAAVIAQFNDLPDVAGISPGMVLQVPVSVGIYPTRTADNQVYSYDPADIYGVDMALDADGNLLWGDGGDIKTVSGSENLRQAIVSRLSETLGARTRQTAYGINAAIGSPNQNVAPAVFLASSIIDTVKQDPRVSDVTNLQLSGNEDKVYYTFDIIGIGGDNIPVSGAF